MESERDKALSAELAVFLDMLGLSVDRERQRKILQYLVQLEKWNSRYNLTALKDREQMLSRHVFESLVLAPVLGHFSRLVVDVGSGCGAPGLPVSIVSPQHFMTLLDCAGKKTAFLRQVVITLGLKKVQVCTARAEKFRTNIKYDWVISRAVAPLGKLVTITEDLLKPDGCWGVLKGNKLEEEFRDIPKNVEIKSVKSYEVVKTGKNYNLVVLSKSHL